MPDLTTKDIIDNLGENTLTNAISKLMPSTERLDALVGYFYFSGFKEIYEQVEKVNVRILVGMELDPSIIDKLGLIEETELDNYLSSNLQPSKTAARNTYINNFAHVFNKTDIFDSKKSIEAFKVFLNKIKDGSLEIKKTPTPEHAKFYLMTFAEDKNSGGLIPGVEIMGSSNLTYSGLAGQGEHNRLLKESHYYNSDKEKFEKLWSNSENINIANISNFNEFENDLKNKLWVYAKPNPYHVYIRLLEEYFGDSEVENIETPNKITNGQYSDLKYQIDAIMLGIDRLNKFNGVIIGDVAGLGKSIIASTIANNMNLQTLVICPPHLKDQWEDYSFEFDYTAQVFSTGQIEKALEQHGGKTNEMLIIIDEAHKHRNEDTDSYQELHQLCAGNKVVALSATPFNNDPKDIYALIKLFDTPGQSTLTTVENLSTEFTILMSDYKKLRNDLREDKSAKNEIQQRGDDIAQKLRQMIEPIIIRRSRLDLEEITEYRDDLKRQNISFASVKDPILLEYDLGVLSDLYLETLDRISDPDEEESQFIGARYKPVSYLKEGSIFFKELFKDSPEVSAEQEKQSFLAGQGMITLFMRRLLVKRFESSLAAFRETLKNMIASTKKTLDYIDERKVVPIDKKGNLPEIEDLILMDEDEQNELIQNVIDNKKVILIPFSEIQPHYKDDLLSDIKLLEDLHDQWFSESNLEDPKFNHFYKNLESLLSENPDRKIVVFSEYSDTVNYVADKLEKAGARVFKYESSDSSPKNKKIIKDNFDAGLKADQQENDYDILVATDAISEGYNLHRAGVVINYDIPYNPTKVIQRVGRINRMNKQVFDYLHIYNFFPTFTGEMETKTKAISTLKINLIHSLLGEDTKILTDEEELRNYFADEYRKSEKESETLSWDAKHRKVWLDVRTDSDLMEKVKDIPLRTRIGRKGEEKGVIVSFGRLGLSHVFAKGHADNDPMRISAEEAFNLFYATPEDKPVDTSLDFDPIYQLVKSHLFKKNTQVVIKKNSRKSKTINHIKLISNLYPNGKDHCDDLVKIIKDYDGFPDGLLKSLSEVSISKESPAKSFDELKKLVSEEYIEKIINTAQRSSSKGDFVLLSEEII